MAVEYRWAEGQYDRLPALAADLVRRQVALITATGGTHAARAAKAATTTISILFLTGLDPVREGLVASFNRPGGNATGVSVYTTELAAKRLELLRDLVPHAKIVALLVNPTTVASGIELAQLEVALRSSGQQLLALKASSESEIEVAFAIAAQKRADALVVRHRFIVHHPPRAAYRACSQPWDSHDLWMA